MKMTVKTKRPTILLIEDDPNDARLVAEAIGGIDPVPTMQVLTDGEEGLDFLIGQAKGADPDPIVLFLDIKLPRMGGLEVIRRVRAEPELADTIIVAVSSSENQTDIRDCYDFGANGFVVKPVSAQSFRATLREAARYWLDINRGLG